jgi:hypothetical protein
LRTEGILLERKELPVSAGELLLGWWWCCKIFLRSHHDDDNDENSWKSVLPFSSNLWFVSRNKRVFQLRMYMNAITEERTKFSNSRDHSS